jgi:Caspase domain
MKNLIRYLAFFLSLVALNSSAELILPVVEGQTVSGLIEIKEKTFFQEKIRARIELPKGEWNVRSIQKRYSTGGTPQEGRQIWLDKVIDSNISENLLLEFFETNSINWNISCTTGIFQKLNVGGLNTDCFSVDMKKFMTDNNSKYQTEVRKKWIENGLSWTTNSLSYNGIFQRRGYGNFYIYYSIPTKALGIEDVDSIQNSKLHNSNIDRNLSKDGLDYISSWYKNFHQNLSDSIYVSDQKEFRSSSIAVESPFGFLLEKFGKKFSSNKVEPFLVKPQANLTEEESNLYREENESLRKRLEEQRKAQELALAEETRKVAAETAKLRAEAEAAKTRQRELESQLASGSRTSINYGKALNAHALIIGNGSYGGSSRLPNPLNDAKAMSGVLRGLGFTVTESLDADRSKLVTSLSQFSRTAVNADITLLFYAGHGVQISGTNYMLPVDLNLNDLSQVPLQGISLNSVVEQYLPGKTKLVFLDACRDNPLMQTASRSVSRGLAPINVSEGTLISYSTKDGQVAQDGDGKNSPFTTALLKHLGDPDDIAVVLRKVREDVMRNTGGKQQPWEYGSLTGGALVLSAIKPTK